MFFMSFFYFASQIYGCFIGEELSASEDSKRYGAIGRLNTFCINCFWWFYLYVHIEKEYYLSDIEICILFNL